MRDGCSISATSALEWARVQHVIILDLIDRASLSVIGYGRPTVRSGNWPQLTLIYAMRWQCAGRQGDVRRVSSSVHEPVHGGPARTVRRRSATGRLVLSRA